MPHESSAPGARPAAQAAATAAILTVSAYIAAQMLSDVASLKIGLVGGWAVDMGTFIYPITFTLRDLVHRVLGRRGARTVVFSAGAVNLLMAGYFAWIVAVPSDPGWGRGTEFTAIFAPMWRIVIASILAEIVSQLANTEVYHWFVTRVTRRHLWARVLVSNAVAVPVDNLIFCLGAFALQMPWSSVMEIFLFNLVVKMVMTLVSIPLIYLVPSSTEAAAA
jgi:queuosine precursor transporter